MASAEGTDSIELESVFSSKNRDFHSSTLKSTSGTTDDGKFYPQKIKSVLDSCSIDNCVWWMNWSTCRSFINRKIYLQTPTHTIQTSIQFSHAIIHLLYSKFDDRSTWFSFCHSIIHISIAFVLLCCYRTNKKA